MGDRSGYKWACGSIAGRGAGWSGLDRALVTEREHIDLGHLSLLSESQLHRLCPETWLPELPSGCWGSPQAQAGGISIQSLSHSVPSDRISPEQQGQPLPCPARNTLCFPALHSTPVCTKAARLGLGPLRTPPSLTLAEQGGDRGTVFQRRAAALWQQKFCRFRCSSHPPSGLCRLRGPAPGRR